jgi:putative peptide maturation dehydrogenase
MARVRRTPHFVLLVRDAGELDLAALLSGRLDVAASPMLTAFSSLTSAETGLEQPQLDLLLSVPAEDWLEQAELDAPPGAVEPLLRAGLLVSDSADPELAELRARDERIGELAWHPAAALYHAASGWLAVDAGPPEGAEADAELVTEALAELVRRHGEPPSHFYSAPGALKTLALPRVPLGGALGRALGARRTTRRFDPAARLPLDTLARLLGAVFGATATAPLAGDSAVVKKTSPSGGALHPVEAYPLVLSVEGLEPGIYHYGVERHELELLTPMSEDEARSAARSFVAGQTYFDGACFLVVLAARFARSFWKYRHHERAYAVLLLDAGHLGQTFALVCAELGLGTFFTAAVNSLAIDEHLGFERFDQGSLAVLGCGVRLDGSPFEPPFVTLRLVPKTD